MPENPSQNQTIISGVLRVIRLGSQLFRKVFVNVRINPRVLAQVNRLHAPRAVACRANTDQLLLGKPALAQDHMLNRRILSDEMRDIF